MGKERVLCTMVTDGTIRAMIVSYLVTVYRPTKLTRLGYVCTKFVESWKPHTTSPFSGLGVVINGMSDCTNR